ncbi:uncharacterized protein WM277_024968 [Molossus nigricans]
MSPSILLTLLCLGIASAAPTTDHSSEAQPTQRTAAPGNILDTMTDIFSDIVKATTDDKERRLSVGETQSSGPAVRAPVGETLKNFRQQMYGSQSQEHKQGKERLRRSARLRVRERKALTHPDADEDPWNRTTEWF